MFSSPKTCFFACALLGSYGKLLGPRDSDSREVKLEASREVFDVSVFGELVLVGVSGQSGQWACPQ